MFFLRGPKEAPSRVYKVGVYKKGSPYPATARLRSNKGTSIDTTPTDTNRSVGGSPRGGGRHAFLSLRLVSIYAPLPNDAGDDTKGFSAYPRTSSGARRRLFAVEALPGVLLRRFGVCDVLDS